MNIIWYHYFFVIWYHMMQLCLGSQPGRTRLLPQVWGSNGPSSAMCHLLGRNGSQNMYGWIQVYIQCLLYTLHQLSASIRAHNSLNDSTVTCPTFYVYSTASTQPPQISTSTSSLTNHLFLQYIYSQHAASTVFYIYSKSNVLPSTSSTLLIVLHLQASTYVYVLLRQEITYIYIWLQPP
jgi:hypothetical protein